MAYDRYESRREWREPRARFRDEGRFDREDRGFFERAGDEIASWFGDEEAERRRRVDHPERFHGQGRDDESGRSAFGADRDRDFGRNRAFMSDEDFGRFERTPRWRDEGYRRPYTGRSSAQQDRGSDDRSSPYRPMTGDTGRGFDDRLERGGTYYGVAGGAHERHYGEWRQRQIDDLDRDYDDYRRENQSRFESDFASWRDRRQNKRQLLGQVREHMQVVGSDDQPVGTVDHVAGDRLILAKTDPEAGGVHHSLMCTTIERIEGDRVILDLTAEEAQQRWRDESRDRALFEREDQGEAGPHMLNRSFSGTY